MTDGGGGLLGAVVAGANVVDAQLLKATLEAIVVERPAADVKQNLCLDKGYDNPTAREALASFDYIPHIRRIGEEPPKKSQRKRRAHKTLTDWMRQALLQLRRWLLERTLIFVGDSNYAVLELLARMTQLKWPITMVTRCRMDAALYEPLTPRMPGQRGRPRKKGKRKPTMLRIAADPATHWSLHTVGYW